MGFLVELINTRETPRKIVKQSKLACLNHPWIRNMEGRKGERTEKRQSR